MSLKDIQIKRTYFSPMDDVVNDFFVRTLKESVSYDRGTGFFTSGSLVELSQGIMGLIRNGGHIRVVTSPRFSEEDWCAITDGYDLKRRMTEVMLRDMVLYDQDCENRIILLSKLITAGLLDIRVAIMKENNDNSMFHAKFGIMTDSYGNSIAFTGSGNDSLNGLKYNWEMISIVERHYSSNDNSEHELQEMFDALWEGDNDTVKVYEIPDDIKIRIQEYSSKRCIYDGDLDITSLISSERTRSLYFKCPPEIVPKDYQLAAVEKWVSQGYSGIFNMATGTGKTITALLALERLYNEQKGGIFTIVVCPQKHLVDQWVENISQFDVTPIIGYSDSKIGNWKSGFKNAVMNLDLNNNYCLVTTINSFTSDEIFTWICKIKRLALVIDEAHNMGSQHHMTRLPDNAQYRLGLSATIERYEDPVGTRELYRYLGPECINLPISEAIGKVLTNYYYYPIPCHFDDAELELFKKINSRIDEIQTDDSISKTQKQKMIREQQLKGVLLMSRLKSKIDTILCLGKKLANDDHMLIYCGRTRWNDSDDDDKELQKEGVRLIDKITSILGTRGVGIKLSKFTYMESPDERKTILQNFEKGRVQALVAISCLDEGVDVRSIKTAIITSSSENPKEYIQRRGRVLRKYPGKEYATIYDLVAIPRNLCSHSTYKKSVSEMKLLCREISRIREFSKDSINPAESQQLLDKISLCYGIGIDEMMDKYWK